MCPAPGCQVPAGDVTAIQTTPGHSGDRISLIPDEGMAFRGDMPARLGEQIPYSKSSGYELAQSAFYKIQEIIGVISMPCISQDGLRL